MRFTLKLVGLCLLVFVVAASLNSHQRRTAAQRAEDEADYAVRALSSELHAHDAATRATTDRMRNAMRDEREAR